MGNKFVSGSATNHPSGISNSNWDGPASDSTNFCLRGKNVDLNTDSYHLGNSKVLPYKVEPTSGSSGNVLVWYQIDDLASDCSAARAFMEMKRDELADDYGNINGRPKDYWFNDYLMKLTCDRRGDAGYCPKSSSQFKDSDGNVICSAMLSCDLCKQWALNTTSGIAASDQMMSTWCDPLNGHYNPLYKDDPTRSDPACKCARVRDRSGADTNDVSASCWYGPCQDRGLNSFLVPSRERNIDTKANCSDTLCQVIWDVENSKDINVNDINTTINCGENPNPEPEPEPEPSIPDVPDDGSAERRKTLMIIGGGMVGAVGIGLLITYYVRSYKK